MNKRASVLLALMLAATLTGCGSTDETDKMTDQATENNQMNELPNAPDNGSGVQGDNSMVGDDRMPDDGTMTQDAKDMADDAGDMVRDTGDMVGDAAKDAGDAVKDAADSMTGK